MLFGTFEPDYMEKYHSFLLTERIVSDALTALLLVKTGRKHPKIDNTLEELKKVKQELINSKENKTPTGYVSSALMQILREDIMLEEMIQNLNQLIEILEAKESPDDTTFKNIINYFIDKTGKLGERFEAVKQVVLGITKY
jgi:chaperonin cofactor prefoldin